MYVSGENLGKLGKGRGGERLWECGATKFKRGRVESGGVYIATVNPPNRATLVDTPTRYVAWKYRFHPSIPYSGMIKLFL